MSTEHTRRDFLKFSTAALTAGAASNALAISRSATSTDSASGDINVWVTDDKRRFESAPALVWRKIAAKQPEKTVTLDPGKKFQELLGFGAAFTDASCYLFSQL